MKTLNIKYIIYSLVAVGSITACTKDYLKPDPLSFYSPDNTYTDVAGMKAGLNACAANLRLEWFGDGAPIITEAIFSEIAVEGTTDKSGPAQDMNIQITPDAQLDNTNSNRIGFFWREGYKGIKYANTIISRIDNAKYASDAERNAILGAAYFHRAYRYYRLTQQFGDVPVTLTEITTPSVEFYTTKREVILKKIKEDLEFAEKWVPDNVMKGEVTKGAVSHLLTKVNLALGLFDDAIKSASNVIDGGVYKLMTARFGVDKANAAKNIVWDMHRPENKSLAENKEALMVVISRPGLDGRFLPITDNLQGMQSMRQATPFWHNTTTAIRTPTGNLGMTDAVTAEFPLTLQYGRGLGRCRATSYSTKAIWNDATDLRHAKGNWIEMEDLVYNSPALKGKDPFYGKNLQFKDAAGKLLMTDTIRGWFAWPQYKLFVPDGINTPPRGGDTDWYVFRLAETYLLRAEAQYWKGNLVGAMADLNVVKARANAQLIVDASTVNIGTILDERNRELYYEEPRKTELTRIAYIFAMTGKVAYNGKTYGMANFSENNFFYDRIMEKNSFYNKGVVTIHNDKYTMSPYHVLWPIPADAIRANSSGHINQNKGYSGFESNVAPLDKL